MDNPTDPMEVATSTKLQLVDATFAQVAPDIALYPIEKYHHLADEQLALHTAEGERHAGPHFAQAEALGPAAEAQDLRCKVQAERVKSTSRTLGDADLVLSPYVTRPRHAHLRYWIWVLILLGGDVAGIAGSAINSGEVIWLAVTQALAVAATAIVVGHLATEVKHLKLRRERAKPAVELTEQEKPYAVLFRGPDSSEFIIKLVVIFGLLTVLLTSAGILTLRAYTDGALPGLVFGFLAGAVSLGSWANSYTHADDIADRLEVYRANFVAAKKEHAALSNGGPRADQRKHAELADSLYEASREAGLAAAARMAAAGVEVLINNPAVAGHGKGPAPLPAAGAEHVDLKLNGRSCPITLPVIEPEALR
ncbi:MAG: hypothetical protein ACRD0K_14445 [Egibacteraceae bacterium]